MKMKKTVAMLLSVLMTSSVVTGSIPMVSAAEPDDDISFHTSFEIDEPLAHVNTVEKGQDGLPVTSHVIPGEIGDDPISGEYIGKFTGINGPEAANYDDVIENLTDCDPASSYLTNTSTPELFFDLESPVVVRTYAMTSSENGQENDPVAWTLSGSNDKDVWTELDTRTYQFNERGERASFSIENDTAFQYYRLTVTENGGADSTSIAEFALGDPQNPLPEQKDGMLSIPTGGPIPIAEGDPIRGWTGVRAFQISGVHQGSEEAYSQNVVYDNLSIPVNEDTRLSYLVFPQWDGDDYAYDYDYTSSYVAVDLHFTDGTYLSQLNAVDQYGNRVEAAAQGESKYLCSRQWNHVYSDIGDVANGKTIDRILISYHNPSNPKDTDAPFRAYFDDISIKTVKPTEYDHLSDYVNILRGTNDSEELSRGLTAPFVTMPHGFNFWAPANDTGKYIYRYQTAPQNRFKYLTVSHVASYWIGDRGTYEFMANTSLDMMNREFVGLDELASDFSHENEIAKAHYYSVAFDEGSPAAGARLEVTPTEHAAVIRFTFDKDSPYRNVVLSNTRGGWENQLGPNSLEFDGKTFHATSNNRNNGMNTMYIYGEFDVEGQTKVTNDPTWAEIKQGVVSFPEGTEQVTLKVATSFISPEQAEKNLALEISEDDTFDTVYQRAQKVWDDRLSTIEVEGATEEQKVTLYSNLYRLYSYPNLYSENTGTKEEPHMQYMSPYGENGAVIDGVYDENHKPEVKDGVMYTTNGFWDTYRTAWAAYELFDPEDASQLLDGMVQHYKDTGWMPRWVCPGGRNSMVGTSSDVIFGDALLRGMEFDYQNAYDSALRNGLTLAVPGTPGCGRDDFNRAMFYGYNGREDNDKSVSWSMEEYINDAGVAKMAKAMMDQMEDKDSAEYQKLNDEYQYFNNRALYYTLLFNPKDGGWFYPKNYDGTWQEYDEVYDPKAWGNGYTETNGWNSAFFAPQDAQGMANLYGGRDKLAEKLDQFFSEKNDYTDGSYGPANELRECRELKMGQYSHNNQPAHHIIYMYNYAGRPDRTQEKVREVLDRLYIGSSIGQGYPGDEDNGEMSAWYLLSALGIYPADMGSGNFVIGAPLFTKATVNMGGGKTLVVEAPNNSKENIYVQGVTLNGEALDRTYLNHDEIANGGVLHFDMTNQPSGWGRDESALPPSMTTGDEVAQPAMDITSPGVTVVSSEDELSGSQPKAYVSGTTSAPEALFDNDFNVVPSFEGNTASIVYYTGKESKYVSMYTLSSKVVETAPSSWTLYGSDNGVNWTVLDQRQDEVYQWADQMRPFAVANPARYRYYKIDVTGTDLGLNLAEFELLGLSKEEDAVHSASTDKDSYLLNETITLTVRTSMDCNRIALSNENGKYLGISKVKSVFDIDNQEKVWTIQTSLGSLGKDRTISIMTAKPGESLAKSDVAVTIDVVAPESDARVLSVSAAGSAKVNEPFVVEVETTLDTQSLAIVNERNRAISQQDCESTTSDGKKVWKVTISVGSTGYRIFTVKAKDAYGQCNEEHLLTLPISIVK